MAHGTNQPVVVDARKPEPLDFRAFYAAHFAFVWRCLGLLGVAASGLDDAAQEVFVAAHRRLPDFRGESSHRTWLYGIVRNNARRSQLRKANHDALKGDEPSAQPDAYDRVKAREAVDALRAFLSNLEEKKRDLFVLAVIEQLTIPEVAASLGIPLNTAYARLRALKIEFQRSLEQKRGER
jgi:RNA polymerase sigma-70 factor (ECF subfamily)